MSGLSVQIADLLPVMKTNRLELRVFTAPPASCSISIMGSGGWHVEVRQRSSAPAPVVWEWNCTELWQGLDAALSWIWQTYGTPREEAK